MGRYNKIFRGPVEKDRPYAREAKADVALAPGTIVTLNTGGEWIAHDTAGARGDFAVLNEDFLGQQNTDTNIAANDVGVAYFPYPPYRFAALVATGNDITAVGTALASNGSGVLAIATTGQEILFFAEEVYNNNTGSNQLVRVRPATGEAD